MKYILSLLAARIGIFILNGIELKRHKRSARKTEIVKDVSEILIQS